MKKGQAERPLVACIGMGSNLGDSRAILQEAYREMGRLKWVRTVALSRPYITTPVAMKSDNRFINAAALVHTTLDPHELLGCLLRIEDGAGRRRSGLPGYEDRTLDLDLLLVADMVVRSQELVVPHPGLEERLFVLQPLADVAAGLIHPLSGLTIRELLRRHPDHGDPTVVRATTWNRSG